MIMSLLATQGDAERRGGRSNAEHWNEESLWGEE